MRVAVAALVPVISICVGTPQVMGLVALAGEVVTEQVRFTRPANPPVELAVMVAVLPVVAPAAMVIAPVFRVKLDSVMVTVPVPVEPA